MSRKIYFTAIIVLAVFASACVNSPVKTDALATQDTTAIHPDSVLFSFVFMGCNRIDDLDTNNSNTNASTANLPQLKRTFTEVCALNPKPAFYFFLGDEVLGLSTNMSTLGKELAAWVALYHDTSFSPISQSGIQMVAIPGNHEMLYTTTGKDGELPNKDASQEWMKIMGSFLPAGVSINRVSGTDSLNNSMTYSFTYRNTHFILMNTDTYNPAKTIGTLPAAWVDSDIVAARQHPDVQHIFLLGHKPAVVEKPLYQPDGDDILDIPVIQSIWPVMEANRVEAMLSAHSHQYYRSQPNANKTYQVITGNGGSLYEKKLEKDPEHQFFGYTIVYVMKNNNVIVQSMGRSVPYANYLESMTPSIPTTIRDQVNITWGTNNGNYIIPGAREKDKKKHK